MFSMNHWKPSMTCLNILLPCSIDPPITVFDSVCLFMLWSADLYELFRTSLQPWSPGTSTKPFTKHTIHIDTTNISEVLHSSKLAIGSLVT